MPLVVVNTPLGQVAINPADVFCIVPEPQATATDCDIRYDSLRDVHALETADAVAAKFAADFRRLDAASLDFDRAWINPRLVSSVVPHPQKQGVCFVTGKTRKIAVKGDLATVVAALS